MQLTWVTDPHFEWLDGTALDSFMESLARSETDGLIVSGDISTAKQIDYHLKRFSDLPMPVYFVLGNHDFYGSSFHGVHQIVRKSVKGHKNLTWLTEAPPIRLTESTYLIGHDGWVDGRAGMGQEFALVMNDYRLISDFVGLPASSVLSLIQNRADAASKRLYTQLLQIGAKHIIVVTHAPPFREACRYMRNDLLPHFSNIGLGTILKGATVKTGARVSVLCGHTHKRARANINSRIAVKVKRAKPGNPSYTTIDVDTGVFNY